MESLKDIQVLKLTRLIIGLAMTLIACLHTLNYLEIPLLDRLNGILYDVKIEAFLPEIEDDRIVIIDIDERSLAAEGRWPWHRDKLAYMTDLLFDYYQISNLSFDIIFSEADIDPGLKMFKQLSEKELVANAEFQEVYQDIHTRYNYDQVFADSLKGRPISLSFYTYYGNEKDISGQLPESLVVTINEDRALAQSSYESFYSEPTYVSNIPVLAESAPLGGFFNNPAVDEDGVYRAAPLIIHHNEKLFPSLALSTSLQYLNANNVDNNIVASFVNGDVLTQLTIGDLDIPVGLNSKIYIPYLGYKGSFNYISATDVLSGILEPDALFGKIVLIGTTAAGLYDQRTAPMQSVFPGVEIHANIVRGILDEDVYYRPYYIPIIEAFIYLVLGVFAVLVFPRLTAVNITILFLLLMAIGLVAASSLWIKLHIETLLATPLLLLLAIYLNQIFYGYFFESRRKKALGKIFGQYIPEKIVSDMDEEPESYALKGERKDLTVLFSDVRNFTTISEGMESTELVRLMNEILTPVTAIIHENKGTIDKYIGDAVMAFWGAPIYMDNHAQLSVKTSLEMLEKVSVLRDEFLRRNWPEIRIGIGINTGPMTVGNMGSEFRLAYTVMGDSVNLGSRLEGLTKQYGVEVIVSEYTKTNAPEFYYRELDLVRVKGKKEPIAIFEPVKEKEKNKESKNSDLQSEITKLDAALTNYRAQQWNEAEALFTSLLALYPGRKLYDVYLERIAEFKQHPPGEDWDGVYTFTSK